MKRTRRPRISNAAVDGLESIVELLNDDVVATLWPPDERRRVRRAVDYSAASIVWFRSDQANEHNTTNEGEECDR